MLESLFTPALLVVAAFFAGGLNAVAGGGTFLTLPALLYAGLPPVAANATGTVALLPGYASGAFGFRKDFERILGLPMIWLGTTSVAGGLIGAALLVVTPDDAFNAMVPWLLLVATVLFAFGPHIADALHRLGTGGPVALLVSLFVVSVYGGYFNGGLGIILLAHLSLFGMTRLNTMNGVKNVLSVLLTGIAVIVYAAGGAVHWREALMMTAAAIIGGYIGARLSRSLSPDITRLGIVGIGLIMTAAFFIR
jgi:uncharacterized membrane protein YfcA